MMMFRLTFVSLSLSACTTAFTPVVFRHPTAAAMTTTTTTTTTLYNQMMNGMASMGMVNTAEYCAEDDDICNLEEEEALMNRLESEAHMLEMNLDEIQNLVYALTEAAEEDRQNGNNNNNDNDNFGYPSSGGDLSEMTFMGLLNTARYCVEEGCDVEYREALVNTLTHQYTVWNVRLMDIVSSLSRLYQHRSQYASDLHGPDVDSLMNSIGSRVRMDDPRHHVVVDMYDMADANGRNYEEDE